MKKLFKSLFRNLFKVLKCLIVALSFLCLLPLMLGALYFLVVDYDLFRSLLCCIIVVLFIHVNKSM